MKPKTGRAIGCASVFPLDGDWTGPTAVWLSGPPRRRGEAERVTIYALIAGSASGNPSAICAFGAGVQSIPGVEKTSRYSLSSPYR